MLKGQWGNPRVTVIAGTPPMGTVSAGSSASIVRGCRQLIGPASWKPMLQRSRLARVTFTVKPALTVETTVPPTLSVLSWPMGTNPVGAVEELTAKPRSVSPTSKAPKRPPGHLRRMTNPNSLAIGPGGTQCGWLTVPTLGIVVVGDLMPSRRRRRSVGAEASAGVSGVEGGPRSSVVAGNGGRGDPQSTL